MRLSDVFRFCSNAHGPSLDTKASAAAPAAAQRSFLLAVAPTANEVPAPEHVRVCSLGLPPGREAAAAPLCALGLGATSLWGQDTCLAAAEWGAEAPAVQSPCWGALLTCSGCSGRVVAEWVPNSGRDSPLFAGCSPGCLSQVRRMQSRPDPVPSSRVAAALTAFPPRTMNLPVGVGAACSFLCACLP